jgi:hypothetical protein
MATDLPVKTDGSGKCRTTLLEISDINGLAAIVYGYVTNPMNVIGGPFDMSGLDIINGGHGHFSAVSATGNARANNVISSLVTNPLGNFQLDGTPGNVLISTAASTGGVRVTGNDGAVSFPASLTLPNGGIDLGGNVIKRVGRMDTDAADLLLSSTNRLVFNGRNVPTMKYFSTQTLTISPVTSVDAVAFPGGFPVPFTAGSGEMGVVGNCINVLVYGSVTTGAGGSGLKFTLKGGPTTTTTIATVTAPSNGITPANTTVPFTLSMKVRVTSVSSGTIRTVSELTAIRTNNDTPITWRSTNSQAFLLGLNIWCLYISSPDGATSATIDMAEMSYS